MPRLFGRGGRLNRNGIPIDTPIVFERAILRTLFADNGINPSIVKFDSAEVTSYGDAFIVEAAIVLRVSAEDMEYYGRSPNAVG